jgi:hypothetical protein
MVNVIAWYSWSREFKSRPRDKLPATPTLLPLTPLTLTTLRLNSHTSPFNPSPTFGLLNQNLYPYIQEQSSMLLVSTLKMPLLCVCCATARTKTYRVQAHTINTQALDIKATWTKTKLHGLSPRANYTDRATAACRRSDCQRMQIEGATWSAWRIPPAVFLGFLDRSRYFSIKLLLSCTHEAECTPFQTNCIFFLVVPGIEPGPPDL